MSHDIEINKSNVSVFRRFYDLGFESQEMGDLQDNLILCQDEFRFCIKLKKKTLQDIFF